MPVSERPPSKTALLENLKNTDDPVEKRKIRAKLRKLGHSGGLGQGRGRKPNTANKPKGRRAKSATAAVV